MKTVIAFVKEKAAALFAKSFSGKVLAVAVAVAFVAGAILL